MSKNPIKVFKFGGASVRSAEAIRQVARVVQRYRSSPLLIVVSAMGKTTNALERVLHLAAQRKNLESELEPLRTYHVDIMQQLFEPGDLIFGRIEAQFDEIARQAVRTADPDEVYDQTVSLGEIISSLILAHYLRQQIPTEWLDARHYIATDRTFREGKVDWSTTDARIAALKPMLDGHVVVTQGFIGRTPEGLTTTLGRDGSDFSAAIFAHGLEAESVTIWKDVPGVMNADPKRLPAAVVFEELPFKEAAEMTYYGASVIHPKTIKPLANKGIPLLVKNFDNPDLPGTRITECKVEQLPPLIVFKDNQCLISCKVTDYTFVNEQQLSVIFQALAQHDVRINLMQNSAITFSFCVDYREGKVMKLIEHLSRFFEVYYNTGLTLVTVKNYDTATFHEYRSKPGLLLEQSSRSTLQVLLKNSAGQ
jgi:aspartate kinase